MYICIIIGCVILLACFGISLGLMYSIRIIIKQIFEQLRELDARMEHVPFPKNHLINLEQFTLRLKKIILGIRSIKPGSN